jgi:hypothetical protein
VLVQAKNDYYAFDIAPGFWKVIKRKAEHGSVRSPWKVFEELAKGGDELAEWASVAKATPLFVEPDENTQILYGTLASHVMKSYGTPQANAFLAGADPWVIACAMANDGIVVTQEKLVGPDSKKIKIPNLCKVFGVKCIDSYDLMRELKEQLYCKEGSD